MARKLMMQSRTVGAVALATQERLVVRPNARALGRWLAQHREALWLAALVLVAAVAHGLNMFHFPFYDLDEGTNFFRAWAVTNEGKLDPYTYWYDHPPLAWMVMAPVSRVLLNLGIFPLAIDTGRVVMLVLHVLGTVLLFQIAHRVTGHKLAARLAAVAFAVSPLGIYYLRRVELDNVATFWILLSLYLATKHRPALRWVWLSGLAMAAAVLSKEPAILFAPGVGYIVAQQTERERRAIAVFTWSSILLLTASLYVLYAVLKGEFFPTGTLLGGMHPHVSLLGTLAGGRTVGAGAGTLWHTFYDLWWPRDPAFIVAGLAAVLVNLGAALRHRGARAAVLLAGPYLVVLMRGQARDYWIVPLLPVIALNVVVAGTLGLSWLRIQGTRGQPTDHSVHGFGTRISGLCWRLCGAVVLGVLLIPSVLVATTHAGTYTKQVVDLYHQDEASCQKAARDWIMAHLSPSNVLVIDSYLWVDLHQGYDTSAAGAGQHPGSKFSHADYYWNVATDPAIKNDVLRDDWRHVDYAIVTPQMVFDADHGSVPFVKTILDHSAVVATFASADYWVRIQKVVKSVPSGAAPSRAHGALAQPVRSSW